jgi:hypothetical protein
MGSASLVLIWCPSNLIVEEDQQIENVLGEMDVIAAS